MPRSRTPLLAVGLFAVVAAGALSLPAQTMVDKLNQRMGAAPEQPAAEPAAADDPLALLRESAAFVGALPHARLDFSYHLTLEQGGTTRKADSTYRLLLADEGRFALGTTGGTIGPRAYSDGDGMVVFPPDPRGRTGRFKISNGIAAFAGSRPSQMVGHGLGGLTLSLLSPVAIEQLLAGATDPVMLADETLPIDGRPVACHHGRITTGELVWDFWVEAGPRPLLRRIVPDLSEEPKPDTPPEEVQQATLVIDFDRWDLATEADPAVFTPMDKPHPMLGKRVPEAVLPLLGGGTQRLGDLVGKKVIVLDFWATWCPPCVASLPTLDAVTQDYADKGVVTFAVNAGEEPGEIESFLADKDWKLPIVLDNEQAVKDALKPGPSLPTKMVIGLDGRVQVAGAGVDRDPEKYRAKLAEEFDALLAKRELADGVLAKWRAMQAAFATP